MNHYELAWKKYAVFSGRTSRKEYCDFVRFSIIFFILLRWVDSWIGSLGIDMLFLIVTIIPIISSSVRRMHDVGRSDLFLLLPIYNFILLISKGTTGANIYGPNPEKEEINTDQILVTSPSSPSRFNIFDLNRIKFYRTLLITSLLVSFAGFLVARLIGSSGSMGSGLGLAVLLIGLLILIIIINVIMTLVYEYINKGIKKQADIYNIYLLIISIIVLILFK